MSYASLGALWGDSCEATGSCNDPDYRCYLGECVPQCPSGKQVVSGADEWWCECADGYQEVDGSCVPMSPDSSDLPSSCFFDFQCGEGKECTDGLCVSKPGKQVKPPSPKRPVTQVTTPKDEEAPEEIEDQGFQYWWLVGAGALLAGATGFYLYSRRM